MCWSLLVNGLILIKKDRQREREREKLIETMKTERICVVKRQRKEYLYIEGDRMLARLFVPILARFCV